MIWTVHPIWLYAAIAGFLGTILIHTVASRLAPKLQFSWIGMLKAGRTSGALLLRLREILVTLLRSLAVFLLLFYLAKPFIYRGKPPAEIWVKDVPFSTLKRIKKAWGDFADIRSAYNPKPKGKVALVGLWSELPSKEYEIWSSSSDWHMEDLKVSTQGIKFTLANSGGGRWFHIDVISQGKTLLKDSIYIPRDGRKTYSATLDLKGPVSLKVESRILYDYALESEGKGKVVAKGLEREVWRALISGLGLDLSVGVDTILDEEGSLNFLTECEKLKDLDVKPVLVEFELKDSGCAFLSGKPILLDGKGQVVGVEHMGRYYFGFHPTSTGWAFTPDFLKLISTLSRSASKVYVEVGDSVTFPEPTEIRGDTRLCCVESFVPKVPGVYELYRDGNFKGVLIANMKTHSIIPPPPKPLWPYIIYAFSFIILLEMALTFLIRR